MYGNGDTPSNHNPSPVVTATQPGTVQQPATTYMYETRGDYTLTETVMWTGSYTFTDAGGAVTAVDLGTTTRTATQPYHVIEVRAVAEQLSS